MPATELVLATCNPADTGQSWAVAKHQAQTFQRLRNTAVDRCVVVQGNSLGNNKAVSDWSCTDDSTMGWFLDPNGLMINRGGLSWCMDGKAGTVGAQVVVNLCSQTAAGQRWHVSGNQLVNNVNNLCVARSATSDLFGLATNLATCDSGKPEQQFALEPSGGWAWQQIRNTISGVCAGVTGTGNGTALNTKPCDANDAQQLWYLDTGGRLFPRAGQGTNGTCADGNNGGNAGATVIVWGCGTQAWQFWTADSGAQTLKNNATGLCAEASGSQIKLQACNGTDAQKWVVETR